ncbi:hypothetical protein E4U43_005040 [Claviceps pusilla]|uniref:Uncharacterized protein n=1 Tax=Claviceps pusilla TaxID=123648 RepID=A0A9P7NER8_9HYPO|nr:hypothetical protein E4U43_005040 [Claviceps pusilla]
MALTIKQLNGDASFLLTFERIDPDSTAGTSSSDPFRILLDPCLAPSSSFPSASGPRQACVSLKDVPEPDVIIISNSRSEHCNEATLRQFARGGPKPLILAEPGAAKVIQGWRHFDPDKVMALHRWRDPRQTGRSTVVRIPVPATIIGGDEGLVTVAFIAQKRERKGLRSAIGITYRPASSGRSLYTRPVSTTILTSNRNSSSPFLALNNSPTLPPLPPFTPLAPSASQPVAQSIRATRSMASLSPHARDRSVSIIFSPHGIPYRDIEPYATSHLLAEAALPLTVLLHSFDTVSRPWWLGGTLTSGFEDGQEIIAKLCARSWISACDAEKNNVNGLIRRFTRRRKYTRDEVRRLLDGPADAGRSPKAERPTEVLALEVGEDVTLTSEGIWPPDPALQNDKKKRQFSIRHIPANVQDLSPGKTTYGLTQRGPAAVAVA